MKYTDPGTHYIEYSASDSCGNETSIIRSVVVKDPYVVADIPYTFIYARQPTVVPVANGGDWVFGEFYEGYFTNAQAVGLGVIENLSPIHTGIYYSYPNAYVTFTGYVMGDKVDIEVVIPEFEWTGASVDHVTFTYGAKVYAGDEIAYYNLSFDRLVLRKAD